jgi:hypothetical protein
VNAQPHACDACGGKPYSVRVAFYASPERVVLVTADLAHAQREARSYKSDSRGVWLDTCPVCQGAGRISDVMPAKDALADAETLRTVAHEVATHCYGGGWDGRQCDDCNEAVLALRIHWSPDGASMDSCVWRYSAETNAQTCRDEAHAAFRAVPGLRGA